MNTCGPNTYGPLSRSRAVIPSSSVGQPHRPGGHRLSALLPPILAAVLVTSATLVPAAQAEWSTPATVSTGHEYITGLQLASGPGGELLAWHAEDGVGMPGRHPTIGASEALAQAGGSFGTQRSLPASYASGPMVNLGGGHLAQLILLRTGLNTYRPEVALGSVGKGFGPPQPIHRASGGRASLAGNQRGDLLLAWIAADAHGFHRVVWASARAPGGRFGPPQIISNRAEAEQVTVAVGPQGDMVVAFPDKWGRMLARVRRHRQPWGPVQNLGPAARGTENDVTPFVGDDGRVLVAWYETQLCEGGCVSPGFIRVAVQPAGELRFRREQVLERDSTGLAGAPMGTSLAPVVIAVGDRAPMVIWLAPGATPPAPPFLTPAVVKVAYPKGSGFAAPQAISPPDQQASDVAAAAGSSGAIVTWIRDGPPSCCTGAVFAAVRPPGSGLFGPPEQASPGEGVIDALPTFNTAGHWPKNSIAPWTVAWTTFAPSETSSVVRVSSPLCPTLPSRSPPAVPPDRACLGA